MIAIEQYGAGPFGSLHLADLGAEVIKIEDPRTRGDVGRYIPPFQEGEDSLFFEAFNRNKRSISLDITSDGGRKVFEDLVAKADAVYSNLRGDVPARLRITYNDLRHINPKIVCCSLSGYGMSGPHAKDPAYDYILQGAAGWMSVTGEPDGPPSKTGLSLVDFSGGFVAALSLLAGIHQARRDGVGMDCDVSLFDVAIGLLTYLATWHLTEGYEATRTARSAHPSLVPFQNFPTADGWLIVGCAKEKFWHRLVDAVGLSELSSDERFATFADRRINARALISLLDAAFIKQPTKHWVERLKQAGVPCGQVSSVSEALANPLVAERGLIVETSHPRFGQVRSTASPVRVGTDVPSYRRAPHRDEDREYVLRDLLGYSDDEIMKTR